ncbi:hypothetical protein C9374_001155 [Naegleria lovaniensis]|uniref:Teneurin NHL domain-containing protein n=1 Tax=Naegleria lovaniensis TaxID=51637 RepID=A0AA88GX57_NAELO|nr:uncharacterized protein C9374_001155 [Naegleria lovaniensis]KAG2387561.1 hypothetical protein C9374_001155 [Naegleria lovaniensis]
MLTATTSVCKKQVATTSMWLLSFAVLSFILLLNIGCEINAQQQQTSHVATTKEPSSYQVSLDIAGGYGMDGFTATAAGMGMVRGLSHSVLSDANFQQSILFGDLSLGRIRKFSLTSQMIQTLIGDPLSSSKYTVTSVMDIACAPYSKDVYFIDNHKVRKFNLNSEEPYVITDVIGNGTAGIEPSGNGLPNATLLNYPNGLFFHEATKTLYIADTMNRRIVIVDWRFNSKRTITFGILNVQPANIVVNNEATMLYLTDTANHRVRSVDLTTGISKIIAGNGNNGAQYSNATASAMNVSLLSPTGIALSPDESSLYITETGWNVVRRYDFATTMMTPVAGNGKPGYSGDGNLAVFASLRAPMDVVVSPNGEVIIADYGNTRLRKVDTNGVIHTIAGSGSLLPTAQDNTPAYPSNLMFPSDVLVSKSTGDVFISEARSNRIRKFHLLNKFQQSQMLVIFQVLEPCLCSKSLWKHLVLELFGEILSV